MKSLLTEQSYVESICCMLELCETNIKTQSDANISALNPIDMTLKMVRKRLWSHM